MVKNYIPYVPSKLQNYEYAKFDFNYMHDCDPQSVSKWNDLSDPSEPLSAATSPSCCEKRSQ